MMCFSSSTGPLRSSQSIHVCKASAMCLRWTGSNSVSFGETRMRAFSSLVFGLQNILMCDAIIDPFNDMANGASRECLVARQSCFFANTFIVCAISAHRAVQYKVNDLFARWYLLGHRSGVHFMWLSVGGLCYHGRATVALCFQDFITADREPFVMLVSNDVVVTAAEL